VWCTSSTSTGDLRNTLTCHDAPMITEQRIKLNDGREMPQFGLGVFRAASGGETEAAVLHALRSGYRHIDTAELYRNEEDVGRAIKTFMAESGVKRDELWVTTKLWPTGGRGMPEVRAALRSSLAKLQLSYVDLYLIHSPQAVDLRLEQWKAMEALRDDGLAKSIGVSNYGVHHLKELLAMARHVPAVNQVEINPYILRAELATFCRSHGIAVEAYSPLTKGRKLSDPKLLDLAAKYSLSPAQVLIRWCLQKGYVVIPKSTTPSRIEENAALGDKDIHPDDMALLEGFDEYLVTGWDPTKGP